MTWAKLDDRMHDDPRTEAAGVEAMGLWAMALSYMADYATDGRVSLARCRRLAGSQKGKRYADRLVTAGWWEAHEDGYRLIDWTSYLIPREQVEARSAGATEAGRRGGRTRAAAAKVGGKVEARSGVRSAPVPEPCSGSLSRNAAEALDTSQPTPAPDPDPIPTQQESAHARSHARDDVQGGRRAIPFGPSEDMPKATEVEFKLTPPGEDKPGKVRKRPARELPDDWQPNADALVLGRTLGFDAARVASEGAKMRDWARGDGKIKVDWHATFANWLRTASEREITRGIARKPIVPEPIRKSPGQPPRMVYPPKPPPPPPPEPTDPLDIYAPKGPWTEEEIRDIEERNAARIARVAAERAREAQGLPVE